MIPPTALPIPSITVSRPLQISDAMLPIVSKAKPTASQISEPKAIAPTARPTATPTGEHIIGRAAALLESDNLDGSMELALSNSDATTAQTADFSESTGRKKVTLEEGSQEIKFNDGGGNIAVVEIDSEGEKNITFGNGGDLAIVKGTSTPVNITAGMGKDTIVTAGNNVTVDLKGSATKIVLNGGNVNLTNYDAATGAGIQVDEVSDIERALQNGNIKLNNGAFSFGGATINISDSENASTTVNLFDNKGKKHKVASTHSDGGTIDAVNERANMLLIGNQNSTKSNSSRLVAGIGNDVAFGGAGDYFDLGSGYNRITIDQNRNLDEYGATVAMTATTGITEVYGFHLGFNERSDRVSINDVANTKVFYKNSDLIFKNSNAVLILKNIAYTADSSDLITDYNFIGDTTLSDITPLSYEQGDHQNIYDSNNNSLKGCFQITFTGA